MKLLDGSSELEIYDLSFPLYSGMPVYPGDPPVVMEPRAALSAGDACNLLGLQLGSHTGTHLDAPRHFLPEGVTVDQIAWEALLGPARLVEAPVGESLGVEFVAGLELARVRRLLVRTRPPGEAPPSEHTPGWSTFTPEAAELLAAGGLLLLGTDALSADAFHAPGHPVHRALLGAGVVLLEELDLRRPPVGDYTLVCLPLRLREGDGSPCRAILLREAGA
jgi:arylformamidase